MPPDHDPTSRRKGDFPIRVKVVAFSQGIGAHEKVIIQEEAPSLCNSGDKLICY